MTMLGSIAVIHIVTKPDVNKSSVEVHFNGDKAVFYKGNITENFKSALKFCENFSLTMFGSSVNDFVITNQDYSFGEDLEYGEVLTRVI